MTLNTVCLLLGSNQGNSVLTLKEVTRILEEQAGQVVAKSNIVISESWGYASSNQFYNQAIILKTKFSAFELLNRIMKIEQQAGRIRNDEIYSDRVIDIDILFYSNDIISAENLTIPHPLLHLRRFVLVPLNQLTPGFVHPSLHKTIHELLESCLDPLKVEFLYDPI